MAALKRTLLFAAALGLSIALLECGARLEYRLSTGEAFPTAAYRERLAPAADPDLVLRGDDLDDAGGGAREDADEPPLVGNKALHPYTGYVHDHSGAMKSTNRFGFPGLDPLWPPVEGELRVAIAGGSVALQLFKEGGRRLQQALARHPAFAGRKIRLIGLTLGGYKQPQQLMALVWFLSLGAHFDVVVNLDGFNEVVLPYSDNVPDGVHPTFPRSWKLFAQKSLDGPEIDALIEVREIQRRRGWWRDRLGSGLPSSSAFALRALDRLDANLALELADVETRLRRTLGARATSYQVSGPATYFEDEQQLFDALVDVWRASSLQMHRISEANGIAYFHFLQPNQYVTGSKPFSEEERRSAIRPGPFAPKTAVRATHAALAAAGAGLAADGVRFDDLTALFASEPATVYRDSCCHFNQRGVDAIADRIGEVVGTAVSGAEAPTRDAGTPSGAAGGLPGGPGPHGGKFPVFAEFPDTPTGGAATSPVQNKSPSQGDREPR